MSKIILNEVTGGYNLSTINDNFQKVEGVINDEMLSRLNPDDDPNHMQETLDMNSEDIINAGTIYAENILLSGSEGAPIAGVSSFNSYDGDETTRRIGHVIPSDGDYQGSMVNFDNTGSGMLATNVQAAIDELFTLTGGGVILDPVNVKAFGAVGDGVADDTAAIQAALDSVAADGGKVYIPSGTYKLTGALTMPAFGQHLMGDGMDATVLVQHNLTSNTIECGSNVTQQSISDLRIDAQGVKTAGAAIKLTYASYSTFKNIYISSHAHGIDIDVAIAVAFVDCYIYNGSSVSGTGIRVSGGNDHFFTRVVSDHASGQPAAGIRILASGATWITDCDFIHSGHPLHLRSDNGEITWCFVHQSAFDTSNGHGIYIEPTNHRIVGCSFSDNWTASNVGKGVCIVNNTGQDLSGIAFTGHRSYNNQQEGFYVGGGENVSFDSCQAHGNSQLSSGQLPGFSIAANVNRFRVRNCVSGAGAGFPVSQSRGMIVAAGTSDNYIISGNDFSGNAVAGLTDGGTGQDKQVVLNLPSDEANDWMKVNGISAFNGQTYLSDQVFIETVGFAAGHNATFLGGVTVDTTINLNKGLTVPAGQEANCTIGGNRILTTADQTTATDPTFNTITVTNGGTFTGTTTFDGITSFNGATYLSDNVYLQEAGFQAGYTATFHGGMVVDTTAQFNDGMNVTGTSTFDGITSFNGDTYLSDNVFLQNANFQAGYNSTFFGGVTFATAPTFLAGLTIPAGQENNATIGGNRILTTADTFTLPTDPTFNTVTVTNGLTDNGQTTMNAGFSVPVGQENNCTIGGNRVLTTADSVGGYPDNPTFDSITVTGVTPSSFNGDTYISDNAFLQNAGFEAGYSVTFHGNVTSDQQVGLNGGFLVPAGQANNCLIGTNRVLTTADYADSLPQGLSLQNGWTNFTGYNSQVRKVGRQVTLNFMIKDGTLSTDVVIANIAVGFRPSVPLIAAGTDSNATGFGVEIKTNGDVLLKNASTNSWAACTVTYIV